MAMRDLRKAGAWGGFLGGLGFTLLMFLFRFTWGIPTLPELLQIRIISLIPGALFSAILDTLLFWAKPLLLVSILIGILAAASLLGVLYSHFFSADLETFAAQASEGGVTRGSRLWASGIAWGAALWLLAGFLLMPFANAGLFGADLQPGAVTTSVAMLVMYGTYGLVLAAGARWLLTWNRGAPESEAYDAGRRQVLRTLTVGGAAIAAAAVGLRFIPDLIGSADGGSVARPRSIGKLPPEITPNNEFYKVSKNFFDPQLNAESWRLKVGGLVERPFTLAYEELKALPSTVNYNTLMCISNEVGGDLIGNAQWKGVSLKDLLERAGVKPGVVDLVLSAGDDYTDSIPLEKALDPNTRIVYEMNGEPLPHDHGFPARLIVPGIYGMKNVKWLTGIELVNSDFKGFWEQQGWDDVATYKTMARLDLPHPGSTIPVGNVRIGGVAFAGDRGISRVEVSDDGKTWHPAQVKEALSPYTWVLWTYDWTPPQPGRYTLTVRVFERDGTPQIVQVAPPFPSGSSGLHTIQVRVEAV